MQDELKEARGVARVQLEATAVSGGGEVGGGIPARACAQKPMRCPEADSHGERSWPCGKGGLLGH